VIAPSGEAIFSAPFFDEGLFIVDIELGDVRRERIGLPLLRDERPELHLRELRRILAERTGMAVADASEGPDDEAVVQGPSMEARGSGPNDDPGAEGGGRPGRRGLQPDVRAAGGTGHRHRHRPR